MKRRSGRLFLLLALSLGLASQSCAHPGNEVRNPASAGPPSLRAPAAGTNPPRIIPLWADGAPGSEARRNELEKAQDWWVKNIHNPSVMMFAPSAGRVNGTAVVIVPGGGHRELVFNPEGVEPALYLANLGVTAFALKYRLAREDGSPYDARTPCDPAQRVTACGQLTPG